MSEPPPLTGGMRGSMECYDKSRDSKKKKRRKEDSCGTTSMIKINVGRRRPGSASRFTITILKPY